MFFFFVLFCLLLLSLIFLLNLGGLYAYDYIQYVDILDRPLIGILASLDTST